MFTFYSHCLESYHFFGGGGGGAGGGGGVFPEGDRLYPSFKVGNLLGFGSPVLLPSFFEKKLVNFI